MIFQHKYMKLHMGLVKENFAVVKRKDKKMWKARGFKRKFYYPLFGYMPNFSEIIMLGTPLRIADFGVENLENSRIIDICNCCGTYGMGGPGFFGFKVQGDYGIRWLTYCIWAAGEHILFDDTVLECHSEYKKKYHPMITTGESFERFKKMLTDMSITKVVLSKDSVEFIVTDSDKHVHSIKSYKYSEAFPERGGTHKKRNSYDTGEMKDYWLVTYDDTELKV